MKPLQTHIFTDKHSTNQLSINMLLNLPTYSIILLLSLISSSVIAEHLTITYHFWEKNEKIVDSVEKFNKLVSNSNRFWTSNLVFKQQNEKTDKIQLYSESWKSADILEEVTFPLDDFFLSIFQKFADKLYTNRALDSLPVFDPSVFKKSFHAYDDYEVSAADEESFKFDYWLKVSNSEGPRHGNKYTYALLTKKENFEHWEAILHFISAVKRSKVQGYIVDCGVNNEICAKDDDYVTASLFVFKNDEVYKLYQGDFEQEKVYEWILTIQQPEIRILKEDTVPAYRSGLIPGFDSPRDTVTILFIDTKKSQVWRNYVKYAKQKHGSMHLTALISEDVKQWAFYPAFITMKPRENYVKAFTLHKNIDWNRMVEFLEDGTHPSVHSLTSASEFLYATDTQKPLIVFFDPLNSKNSTAFKMAAGNEQTSERTAFFAEVSGFDLFGLFFMNVFNVNIPNYVVIRRQERGWCVNTRAIEHDDFLRVVAWTKNLDSINCQEFIEDFKFPIGRLHLLERYEDVEDLEREHTAVERNHEEL